MADPLTLGLAAVGGVVSAMGAAQKDDATASMYQYKAGVARANAIVAQQNADYAIQVGGERALEQGIKGAQTLGTEKVAQAASGLDVAGGSASAVRTSQLKAIQQGERTIKNEAARRAYGYKVEGMNFTAEGEMDTSAAQNVETQKGFDVATSLLSGATSVGDKWYKFKNAGVGGGGSGLFGA